jgi:hypothetical protein
LGDLGHAFRAGHGAEGVTDQLRVAVLEHGFEVGCDVVRGFEVVFGAPGKRRGSGGVLLKRSSESQRRSDVPGLRAFVAAGRQLLREEKQFTAIPTKVGTHSSANAMSDEWTPAFAGEARNLLCRSLTCL